MSKKVLILGGARFHGFQLAKKLSSEGNLVYVLNRGNFRDKYPSSINFLKGDREDPLFLKEIFSRNYFDCIFDNNAYLPRQIGLISDYIKNKCNHYIFTSSASVYLKNFSDHLLTEKEATGISNGNYNPFFEQYALNKFECENKIKKIGGKKYTILRTPNVFGEGDFSGKLIFFNTRIEDGGNILLEKEVNQVGIIYVNDLVNILAKTMNCERCFEKTLNISCPTFINNFFSEIYGEKCLEKLTFMSSKEMWGNNYSLPFEWNPPLETSLIQSLIGETNYTPISEWGKKTLVWEKNNLGDIKRPEFSNRGKELNLIKKYNG